MTTTVWRTKLNSMRDDMAGRWDDARTYCRREGVVGLGWGGLTGLSRDMTLDEIIDAVRGIDDWMPAGARMIDRLANKMQDGDLVWTRDRGGAYWLGRITGPWFYDDTPKAAEL